jgi:hypothetical protein
MCQAQTKNKVNKFQIYLAISLNKIVNRMVIFNVALNYHTRNNILSMGYSVRKCILSALKIISTHKKIQLSRFLILTWN